MFKLNKKERQTTIEVPLQTTPLLALEENDVSHDVLAHFMEQSDVYWPTRSHLVQQKMKCACFKCLQLDKDNKSPWDNAAHTSWYHLT